MVDGGGDVMRTASITRAEWRMTTASITRAEWRVVRCEWQKHERRRKSGVSLENGETVDHLTRKESRRCSCVAQKRGPKFTNMCVFLIYLNLYYKNSS